MKHPHIVLVLAALLLGLTTLAYPRMGSDTSTFTYVSRTVLDGGMPYRDAWDLKAPAIFYVYAVPVALFGNNHGAVQALDAIWQVATALVLFAIAVRIYGRREIGLLAGLLYLLVYYAGSFWEMTQAEGFLNLPLALSMLWLLRALENDNFAAWCVSGAFVAVATLFKIPMGLVGIVMIVAAIARNPGRGQAVRRLSALALGFAAPLLLCVIYFQAKGALWDLYTTQIIGGPQHALLNQNGHYLGCAIESLVLPGRAPLYALGFLGLMSLWAAVARKQAVSLSTKLLWGWFAVGLVVLFMHGEFLGYHFIPMYAPVAILSADMVYSVWTSRRTAGMFTRWVAFIGILAVLTCTAYKVSKNVLYERRALHGITPPNEWDAVSDYIKKNTSPGDRIFVWGNRAAIYLDSGVKSASRFLDIYHIARPPKAVDYQAIFLQEFEAARPKYFILHIMGKGPGECGFGDIDQKETFLEFSAFSRLIAEDYEMVTAGDVGPYEVYKRK